MHYILHLPQRLYEDMLNHARAELPNECCGLLAGQLGQPAYGEVVERYALINALASPVEFLSDARSMFEAERDMRQRGLQVLAVYHSHPTLSAVPSKKDRERNYSVDVMNLIISLESEPPVVRAWWLSDTDQQEAAWECVVSPTR